MIKKETRIYGSLLLLKYYGPDEIRTHDPYNANVVRSQLRYKPMLYSETSLAQNSRKWKGKLKKKRKNFRHIGFSVKLKAFNSEADCEQPLVCGKCCGS